MISPLSLPKRYICATLANWFSSVPRCSDVRFASVTPRSFWHRLFFRSPVPKPLKPFTISHAVFCTAIFILVNSCLSVNATTNVLQFVGNSIFVQPGPPTNAPFLMTLPDSTWGKTNLSVSGYTWGLLQAQFPNSGNLYANWNPSASNWAIMMEGGNCIYYGSNLFETCFAASNACYTARSHTNFVIVVTAWSRGDLLGSSNVMRLDYNQWLRTNYLSFANGLIDCATNPLLDYTNFPSNFQGDRTHPTDAGAHVIATNLQVGLNAILTPPAVVSAARIRMHK